MKQINKFRVHCAYSGSPPPARARERRSYEH